MSSIAQYLSDHANAGACAASYYANTHEVHTCRVPAGVCSVIAYLVIELKNAEQRAPLAQPYSPFPSLPNVGAVPVTPVTSGTNGSHYAGSAGAGGGGNGQWNSSGTETRRS